MPPEVKNAPGASQLSSAARPRVLIVDDEPAVRMVSKLMLESGGYAVTEAATAAAGIACVRDAERPFAVILLDLTLPDGNGIELIPELRIRAPRSLIVLSSGHLEEDVPGHGADGYLAKPFTRDQLLAAVRAVTAMTPR